MDLPNLCGPEPSWLSMKHRSCMPIYANVRDGLLDLYLSLEQAAVWDTLSLRKPFKWSTFANRPVVNSGVIPRKQSDAEGQRSWAARRFPTLPDLNVQQAIQAPTVPELPLTKHHFPGWKSSEEQKPGTGRRLWWMDTHAKHCGIDSELPGPEVTTPTNYQESAEGQTGRPYTLNGALFPQNFCGFKFPGATQKKKKLSHRTRPVPASGLIPDETRPSTVLRTADSRLPGGKPGCVEISSFPSTGSFC